MLLFIHMNKFDDHYNYKIQITLCFKRNVNIAVFSFITLAYIIKIHIEHI